MNANAGLNFLQDKMSKDLRTGLVQLSSFVKAHLCPLLVDVQLVYSFLPSQQYTVVAVVHLPSEALRGLLIMHLRLSSGVPADYTASARMLWPGVF